MKRKIVASVLLLLSMCCSAYTFAEGIQPYASTLITTASVKLTCSGTALSAEANIKTKAFADKLGFDYIRIQEKQGAQWLTVKSVSSQYKTDGMTHTHTHTLTYTGTSGSVYRAVVGFYAEDAGTSETRSGTSSSLTL